MPEDEHHHEIIGAGDPRVENDPEVLDEERRLRIKQLRLQYYKDLAGTVKIFLQTFKTEAVSLVSGVSSLVLGYYEVKRWILKGHRETRAQAPVAQAPVKRAKPRAAAAEEIQAGAALVGVPVDLVEPTFVSDPMFYVLLVCGVAFGASSFRWFRRGKDRQEKGAFNGPL